jgi:hypothetical protein
VTLSRFGEGIGGLELLLYIWFFLFASEQFFRVVCLTHPLLLSLRQVVLQRRLAQVVPGAVEQVQLADIHSLSFKPPLSVP